MAEDCKAGNGRDTVRRARPMPAHISPLPPPEAVFLDWLMTVSTDRDIEAAARVEIDRIDRRGIAHPDLDKLRGLFLAFVGEAATVPANQ